MSRKRRAQIARANGRKSKGPVTPEGKARSSQNATKLGLASATRTAATVCLHNESRDEFVALYQAMVEEFAPRTQSEVLLIEDMATARWRMRRIQGVETVLWDDEMEANDAALEKEYETMNEPTRVALAFKSLATRTKPGSGGGSSGTALPVLHRYEARLSRQYDRAWRRLMESRNANLPNEPSPSSQPEETQHAMELPATAGAHSSPPQAPTGPDRGHTEGPAAVRSPQVVPVSEPTGRHSEPPSGDSPGDRRAA